MKRYRFSLGDSTAGVVGLALTVEGESKEEALNLLRYELSGARDGIRVSIDSPVISHAVLFLNTDFVSTDDIEEVEDEREERE